MDMSFHERDTECRLPYFYIHDMTTTTLRNKELFAYCCNNKIDASLIPKQLFDHISRNPSAKTELVVIQCYECDEKGCVKQDFKHLVTVVGQQYSHYVLDEIHGTFERKIAAADEYDFENREYLKHRFRRECFFSEDESNKRVSELFQQNERVFGNSHKFINEFCYDLYEKHTHPDFKGRLIRKPHGFGFPLLSRAPYVRSETVIFGDASYIEAVDDSHIKDYSYQHKTLSFDIETIMVDARGDKIDDQIIQISLVYQEGNRLYRVIGITVGDALETSNFYDYSHMQKFFSNELLPQTEIYCVSNEQRLIQTFIEIMTDVKPDYLAGYNVLGFDLQVLLKAADKYDIDLVKELSSMNGFGFNKFLIGKALSASRSRKANANISTLEDNELFNLSYKLFPGILVNDLYRCHKNEKLDELARSNLGIGKEDVSYADIPLLYYSDGHNGIEDRSKLLKYNVVDSLLCSALINTSDYFSCYKFFVTSSQSSKIPHSEFFNTQKTPMLAPLFYYAFRRKGMLQKMKLKPLKENNRLCITQLLRYYLYNVKGVTHPDAIDLIEKFNSGVIKTKTIQKHFDLHEKYGTRKTIDFQLALQILKEQYGDAKQKNTKHGSHFYTLTHLLLYLRFMTEPTEEEYDLDGLIEEYYKEKRIGRYSPVNVAKGRRLKRFKSDVIDKERAMTEQLKSFVRYLSRRHVAESCTISHLLHDYVSKELTLNKQNKEDIGRFAKYLNLNDEGKLCQSMRDFLFTYKNSTYGQRFQDRYTYETFCEEVFSIIGDHLLMEFDEKSKYDGAYVYLPSPGVVFDQPIACLDFSAMYPSIGINGNFGPETIVSRQTIIDNNLKKGEDYVVVNTHVRDDHKDIDIRQVSEQDATTYVCFLTTKHIKSTYCQVWEGLLNARLKYKKLIGTFDNVEDNMLVKLKSDVLKVIANSCYGILPHMKERKVSACITSKGRQHLQKTAWYLEENRNAKTVYGDTDSVMFHLNMTVDEIVEAYKNQVFFKNGWISERDTSSIDKYESDSYKQACIITKAVSIGIGKDLNEMHIRNPDRAIFGPPSKLEHEKVMLPFVIFGQKHYFAKIMDTDEENSYIVRGLDVLKRNRLLATEQIERAMFEDLLQRKPSTWRTYCLAKDVVSGLLNGDIDLNRIASRKKITVTQSRLNSSKADAGVKLFKLMKQRGEIIDTGGLDKINVNVVKVVNRENKKLSKIESLDYLRKLQRDNRPLDLDKHAIVQQILSEVLTVMSVVHPVGTFRYYQDLCNLSIAPDATSHDFEQFVSPEMAKRNKLEQKPSKPATKQLLNNTLHCFFEVTCVPKSVTSSKTSMKRIHEGNVQLKPTQKTLFGDVIHVTEPTRKKRKKCI